MIDPLQIEIDAQKRKLPKLSQEALATFDWKKPLFEIGKKYGFRPDQLGNLETETELALVGLVPPEHYVHEVKKHLHISDLAAQQLVNDVNEKIFKKLQYMIMKSFEEQGELGVQEQVETEERIEGSRFNLPAEAPAQAGVQDNVEKHAIAEQKLSEIHTIPSSKTDHGLNEEDSVPKKPKAEYTADPYRESIE